MDLKEFSLFRKKLDKTQQQMADILGVSVKSIRSYEQGWRNVPPQTERQVYFLLSNRSSIKKTEKPCWEVKACTQKDTCPVWEFQIGHLCWFICGTPCDCTKGLSSSEKLERCLKCGILQAQIE